jgi:ATP phosphoribosyltransferase regulatory subunit
MHKERWLLPDGIDEMLPPEARLIEGLRRDILDLFDSWGYELVIPPLIEYLESLLTGTGSDLDLQTFKLIDQLTGRLLGVRADMTPQVARMDAHRLRRDTPTRLCYLGTVLHTRADGFAGSRGPLQIGAEIFGHAGVESDLEVLHLMWRTLELAGVSDIYLDLGHVGIFRSLARQAGLDPEQELELFEALQRKAASEIAGMVEGFGLVQAPARMLLELAELNGDDALERARETLKGAAPAVLQTLDYLEQVAGRLAYFLPGVPVHFDLAELRGYHYKTGVVFAAFVPSSGQEVARGGRYDAIGQVFGRARPAVGFSTDLKTLLRLGPELADRYRERDTVAAPWDRDPELQKTVESLRLAGRRVLTLLPGQEGDAAAMGCSGILVREADGWRVRPLGE